MQLRFFVDAHTALPDAWVEKAYHSAERPLTLSLVERPEPPLLRGSALQVARFWPSEDRRRMKSPQERALRLAQPAMASPGSRAQQWLTDESAIGEARRQAPGEKAQKRRAQRRRAAPSGRSLASAWRHAMERAGGRIAALRASRRPPSPLRRGTRRGRGASRQASLKLHGCGASAAGLAA